jgi:hypothetical protein
MKKVALALVLVVAGLSLGGCFVGKGKAPAPVVTKSAMLPAFLPCLYRDRSRRELPGTRPEPEIFGQINP